ncbi:hypothetical protein C8R46DRAFT_651003 [Mycena filopes]|nr:hypothetical protein C8R46DRAFT_651003 [Mycena filopes]
MKPPEVRQLESQLVSPSISTNWTLCCSNTEDLWSVSSVEILHRWQCKHGGFPCASFDATPSLRTRGRWGSSSVPNLSPNGAIPRTPKWDHTVSRGTSSPSLPFFVLSQAATTDSLDRFTEVWRAAGTIVSTTATDRIPFSHLEQLLLHGAGVTDLWFLDHSEMPSASGRALGGSFLLNAVLLTDDPCREYSPAMYFNRDTCVFIQRPIDVSIPTWMAPGRK